jgi:protein-tyrosine phosphatase
MDYINNTKSINNINNPAIMTTNPYDEIIPNLHLGGIKALDNYKNEYNNETLIFYMVVDLIKYTTTNMANESMGQYEQYINLPVHDSPDECDNLLKMIKETHILENIHHALQKNKPVLVHCFAGMQRSCALVACYLIKYYDFTPKNAIDFIKSKRPIAFFGRVNFMDLLLSFAKT